MADHFLEANISGQCAHLIQMLFADEAPAEASNFQQPIAAAAAPSNPAASSMRSMYATNPLPAYSQQATTPQYYGVNNNATPQMAEYPTAGGQLLANQQHAVVVAGVGWSIPPPNVQQQPPPPLPIVARKYVKTATGEFHVQDTIIEKLPNRVLRCSSSKNRHQQGHQPHSKRTSAASDDQQSDGMIAFRMAHLDLAPMSPKPAATTTTFREKLVDKFADVYKVLSRLSDQKFDDGDGDGGAVDTDSDTDSSSSSSASSAAAVRYAPHFMRQPDATLADFWNYLYAGLGDEFDAVRSVTVALERQCNARDGLPNDLVPAQVLAEWAAQVQAFAGTRSLGILTASGPIGVEKENEVNVLLEALDKLFRTIRTASTNIWMLRTIVMCTRERPAAPQTPPRLVPAGHEAASRVVRMRRYGS